MSEKQPISTSALLDIANALIQSHEMYIEGMHVDAVEEKAGVLVFKGNYFLDNNGMPTSKTTEVFNMFKYLAHVLSKKYQLS